MGSKFLAHLRRQWMGGLALFLVMTGGTAMALPGTNTVLSDDIVNGEVKTADISDTDGVRTADVRNDNLTGGGLAAVDLRSGSVGNTEIADAGVRSAEVQNEALTGADIADRSGVDTCRTPLTVKLGPTCAGSDGVARNLADSINYCAGLGLRLPTWSEAVAMAKNYDVPGVSDAADSFWTDTLTNGSLQQELGPIVVEEDGNWAIHVAGSRKAVCVTDPSA